MADTEEYFPRGGKKPTTIYKQSANFLGEPEKGDKKKNKHKNKSEGDDGYLTDEVTREIDQSTKNCAVGLSYQTIKEGVLVLGRVRYVYETKMIVMLPCRLIGSVMACHISEPYNKQLDAYVNDKADSVSELPKMFRPGQYIAVKVLEQKEKSLMLSTMPQHVNGGKPLADVVRGSLFQAAVVSIEDHGYVMDLGVPNTTTFLPKKDVNPDIELVVGMVTWCAVKSVTPSSSNAVVTLSATLGAVQGVLLKKKPVGPLLPGSNVEFTVETPLDNGIEGVVFGDTTCFVQRQHVDKVKGKKPTLGQKIRGRVLYVLPTRNTPFLSMKSIFDSTYPDMSTEQRLKDGDIVEEAQVLKIIRRSVHFKLGHGDLGLLSLKRIQVDEDLADEEVVAKSYPIGSKHKVRVLCYNMSDYVYSVTDQPDILREQYFSMEQLRAGQLVHATVRLLGERHAELDVGRVKGFVPHTHLSEGGVYVDPKKARVSNLTQKKYKVGQKVQARVLALDSMKQNLILTLKPSLLVPDLVVLKSYEDALVGTAYTGVIRYIGRDYLLVSFFANVVAYIPRIFVTQDSSQNIADAFHLGQIVNCTILSVKLEAQKMSGSLVTPPFSHDENRQKNKRRKRDSENEMPHKKHKNDEPTDGKQKKQHVDEEMAETDIKTSKNKKKQNSETNAEEIVENDIKMDKKKKKRETESTNVEHEFVENDIKIDKKKKKRDTESTNVEHEIVENDIKIDKKKKKRDTESTNVEHEIVENDIKIDKQKKKRDIESTNVDHEIVETQINVGKKKKKCDSETSNADEYVNSYKETESKNNKVVVQSEESDEIETDFYEEEFLTPQEQGLLDMVDCSSIKEFKKRLVAITKAIEARKRRSHVVDEKIANLEERGLNSKNKKYHTAMQNEKLTILERISKLSEAKVEVMDKLKELGYERNDNYKEEQKKRKLEKKMEGKAAKKLKSEVKEESSGTEDRKMKTQKEEVKDELNVKQSVDLKDMMKDIKVVESLEPALEVPSAKDFFFGASAAASGAAPAAEDSSSSDEETGEQPKKKRKKQSVPEKLARARAEEERTRALERAAAASTTSAAPRSVEQFQRALLAAPAASQLWIAYMAFHLQSAELDKARAVARRALAAIPFREEQEKLNVWLALLNLEHRFGTKESQQSTLEEALQLNDPCRVHSALLDMYVETGKQQELPGLVDLLQRKYRRQARVYVDAGAACYKLGLLDKARQVMQKALAVLEKKEHVSILVQFALLERRLGGGGRERAEALFEQVLAVYPQRVDVCATYVDMLLKDGDLQLARQVLERMTSLKLPARKMKILYKKWIEVEEKIGDEVQVENIRQRAMEFIEKAKF